MLTKGLFFLAMLVAILPIGSHSFVVETELNIDPERRMIVVDYLSPIYYDKYNNAFLFSTALRVDNLDSIEGDLGGAYRREISNNKILGINYFIYTRSIQNMLFNQHSVGFEYLTDLLDFRINKYIGAANNNLGLKLLSNDVANIVTGDVNAIFEDIPYVMSGYDAALGFNLGTLYASATVFSFKGTNNSYVGARGRIEAPIELADRVVMKIGAEIFGDNENASLNYRVFVRAKILFGNSKKNATSRLLTEGIIRDKDIRIHKGKGTYTVPFPNAITSRYLIIEDPITGINREEFIANGDIKIANSAAELNSFLRQVSVGTNNKLFLIQDNFNSTDILDVTNNPNIQNVFIAGSAAIKAGMTTGEQINYTFNPDRDFAKGNPILLNFKGLSGVKYTLH